MVVVVDETEVRRAGGDGVRVRARGSAENSLAGIWMRIEGGGADGRAEEGEEGDMVRRQRGLVVEVVEDGCEQLEI